MAEEVKKQNDKKQKDKKDKKKIEFAIPLGMVLGLIIIFAAIYTSGKIEGVKGFFDIASILIVICGLSSALIINFGFGGLKDSVKISSSAFIKVEYDLEKMIDTFIDYATRARKQGLLSLEGDIKKLEDKFLQKGMQLAIDGYDAEALESILQKDIEAAETRYAKAQDFLDKGAEYAPAWGMIGTLVGLILMLRNLDDPASLGPSMALAMLTTLYGSVIANLFFAPLLGKLNSKVEQEMFAKKMVLEAVLEIQAGKQPKMLKAQLESYIDPNAKPKKEKKKKVDKAKEKGVNKDA